MVSPFAVRRAIARKQAVLKSGSVPAARLYSMAAPHGGLNTRDAPGSMKETDALELINWFPKSGGLVSRNGHADHATGIGSGDVWTIAEFQGPAARKLISFSATAAYDASDAGAVGAALKSGLTSVALPRDWVNFNGSICFVDGTNTPQQYDGTTWADAAVTGMTGVPYGINVYKNRLYYWADEKQSVWYAALNTIGGALTEYNLSRVFAFGGKLVSMTTWTRDGGEGPDDFAAFIFSSGQVAVYSGIDPGDAAWSLVGVYNIPEPLGRDAIVRFGSDIAILTKEDFVFLSPETLQSGQARKGSKLIGAAREAARLYSGNTGWAGISYPNGEMMLFNVPRSATAFDQFVLNTATGAWTKFKGMNGRGWGLYDGSLYFGRGDGSIAKADSGESDDGEGIALEAQTEWGRLGLARTKRVTAVRPILMARGTLSLGLGIAYDFASVFADQPISSASAGTAWDTGTWDTDEWAPEISQKRDWFGAAGMGVDVSVRLRGNILNQVASWYRTDFQFIPGGFI